MVPLIILLLIGMGADSIYSEEKGISIGVNTGLGYWPSSYFPYAQIQIIPRDDLTPVSVDEWEQSIRFKPHFSMSIQYDFSPRSGRHKNYLECRCWPKIQILISLAAWKLTTGFPCVINLIQVLGHGGHG